MRMPFAILVIFLLILLALINFTGFLHPLNGLLPQRLDTSCEVDSDCKLHVDPDWTRCSLCDECKTHDIRSLDVVAISASWEPFCPFAAPYTYQCEECESSIDTGSAVIGRSSQEIYDSPVLKCVDKKCVKG